jgi:hypothetical protein
MPGPSRYGSQAWMGTQGDGGLGSTAIADLKYSGGAYGTLRVTFTTGRTYDYSGVSAQRYTAFKNAPSLGRYFNKAIKNNYSYRRVG